MINTELNVILSGAPSKLVKDYWNWFVIYCATAVSTIFKHAGTKTAATQTN